MDSFHHKSRQTFEWDLDAIVVGILNIYGTKQYEDIPLMRIYNQIM